jgi:hypothetical protein
VDFGMFLSTCGATIALQIIENEQESKKIEV